MNIKISHGNAKLGSIPSVSLPAGLTCRCDCDCQKKCYAKRLERIRKSVREAYRHKQESRYILARGRGISDDVSIF